ncbi:HAD family hydrolase [Bifidobacterium jacchi]|uniref:HAD family hydrolase n=1 Tax=Bifidobacterium jacchi TaxID=2490545 RepID=A0A5N5RIL1_9BIFI|nr:HAD family hydrolase [Bifidobacterium jacchi]
MGWGAPAAATIQHAANAASAANAQNAATSPLSAAAHASPVRIPLLGDPGVGQWLIIAMVLFVVVDTVRGMIDDIRHGQVGVDLLAVVAILSTLAVGEYWASWAVMLMIASGEAIEEYAQAKAEGSLTALMQAAPRTAHLVDLPGVNAAVGAAVVADYSAHPGTGRPAQPETGERAAHSGDAQGPKFAPMRRTTPRAGHAEPQFRTVQSTTTQPRPTAPSVTAPQSQQSQQPQQPQRSQHLRDILADSVRAGDVLAVLPGETVPVDGELLSGSATLDLSAINGEPMPREVFAGARVPSGAINGSTMLMLRATRRAADSQYQRIVAMVDSARRSRPAVVRAADRMAVPFTLLSLAIAAVAWAVSGVPTRFAQVLVLATPCPLLIAAPVAYIAGAGRLARAGVLVKSQDVIESLGRVGCVFFDKTGTLTTKRPQVTRVEMLPGAATRLDEDHVLMLAGVVEGYSVHILSQGIAKAGAAAMERLRARFAAGQRHCPDVDVAGALAGGGAGGGAGVRGCVDAGVGNDADVAGIADASVSGALAGEYPGAYPVVTDVVEESGRGVRGVVNGHAVRVGRLSFANAHEDGFQPTLGAGASGGAAGGAVEDVVGAKATGASEAARDGIGTTAAGDATTAAAAAAAAADRDIRTRFGVLRPDEMASYVAVDGMLIARIVLRDVPRENARETVSRLRSLGVSRIAMLTGDKRASAAAIARETGVGEVHAELFPEDKLAVVAAASGAGELASAASRAGARGARGGASVTMMVGDGVNDAPVLAAAGVGVAMTDGASTAASESAQAVIMNDDIAAVPRMIAIARRTRRVMMQAVLLGLALAVVGMIAAAFNLIPVVVGAFAQEAIDVVSILWALTALLDRD